MDHALFEDEYEDNEFMDLLQQYLVYAGSGMRDHPEAQELLMQVLELAPPELLAQLEGIARKHGLVPEWPVHGGGK